MKMHTLGRTGISVSRICLGTMTFGHQNTEAEGHQQMDMAAEHGVNFFDSAATRLSWRQKLPGLARGSNISVVGV